MVIYIPIEMPLFVKVSDGPFTIVNSWYRFLCVSKSFGLSLWIFACCYCVVSTNVCAALIELRNFKVLSHSNSVLTQCEIFELLEDFGIT